MKRHPKPPAALISRSELEKIANLSDRQLRNIAAKGYFPPPGAGGYNLLAAFAGLVKYYQQGSDRLNALKEEQMREDIKLTTAEASIKQMEEEKLRGDSMDTAAVGKLVNECFLPVRQRIDSLPSEMSSRCNPSDPQLARAALEEWKVGFYAQVSEKLPKVTEMKKGKKK